MEESFGPLAVVLPLEEAETISGLQLQTRPQCGLVCARAVDGDGRDPRRRRGLRRDRSRLTAERDVVADGVETIAFVERDETQVDASLRFVPDDPRQPAALLQAL